MDPRLFWPFGLDEFHGGRPRTLALGCCRGRVFTLYAHAEPRPFMYVAAEAWPSIGSGTGCWAHPWRACRRHRQIAVNRAHACLESWMALAQGCERQGADECSMRRCHSTVRVRRIYDICSRTEYEVIQRPPDRECLEGDSFRGRNDVSLWARACRPSASAAFCTLCETGP